MPTSLPIVRDSFEKPDICRSCATSPETLRTCCQQSPGIALPEDVGAPNAVTMQAEIAKRLRTGRWAVDWWEGDPREGSSRLARALLGRALYLRPATENRRGRVWDPSWGGACNFLGPNGCEIFADRPSGCRGLEPLPLDERKANGGCRVQYAGKQEAAIAWIPYQRILESIAEEVDAERRAAV